MSSRDLNQDKIEKLNLTMSPFLRLPAELREQIWLQTVADLEVLDIIHPTVGPSK